MAALACACGLVATAGPVRASDTVENKVNLQLQIAGLDGSGCTVEVKPAHPGCQFKTIVRKVPKGDSQDVVILSPIAFTARSTGADHDCSFAITVTEPGRPPKTYRRGVRLVTGAAGQPQPVKNLKIYLSAPSIAASEDRAPARR
jgi:hypothetical protein